jgi:glycosyltransferase involved in cell wall biosynthesis
MGGGGAERQLAYLTTELVTLGWDVHVALVSGGPNLERLRRSGATLHLIAAAGNYDPRIFWNVFQLIDRVKPDLVQVWMLQMEVIGAIAAGLRGVPLIWSERCSERAYPATVKSRLRGWVAHSARAVVANSSDGLRYWSDRLDPEVPGHVIPNALPLDEIRGTVRAGSAHTGVSDSDVLLLFAGRLIEQKNPETVMNALVRVLDTPGRIAVFAGEGPLRDRLRSLATALGIESRVRFPGYVTNLWAWMKRADVFLSPSLFEGHPNTVLEAAACGCPLVISDIAAHREFLDDSAAVLIPAQDTDALEAGIVGVLDHPGAARRRVERAAEVMAQWSTESIARRYEQVYLDVMGAPGRQ